MGMRRNECHWNFLQPRVLGLKKCLEELVLCSMLKKLAFTITSSFTTSSSPYFHLFLFPISFIGSPCKSPLWPPPTPPASPLTTTYSSFLSFHLAPTTFISYHKIWTSLYPFTSSYASNRWDLTLISCWSLLYLWMFRYQKISIIHTIFVKERFLNQTQQDV